MNVLKTCEDDIRRNCVGYVHMKTGPMVEAEKVRCITGPKNDPGVEYTDDCNFSLDAWNVHIRATPYDKDALREHTSQHGTYEKKNHSKKAKKTKKKRKKTKKKKKKKKTTMKTKSNGQGEKGEL
jgi:hypothetical protein